MNPFSPTGLVGFAVAVGVALAAGAHVCTWGAFKDAPYEGYHPWRQLRTIVLAASGAVVGTVVGLIDLRDLFPALGVVYSLERLATEWWKTIVRTNDQAAYAIPMRLGFLGRPVETHWVRYLAGTAVAAAVITAGWGVHRAQAVAGQTPTWLVVLTVGGLGGWLTAIGGAWKDAPIEGFSGWKFLRSPVVAIGWAVPLSLLTSNWVTLCLSSGGLAVASIETYKTFLTGDRAPGKFAGKVVHWHAPRLRRNVGRLHALSWLAFSCVVVSQSATHPTAATAFASGAIGTACLVLAAVVLGSTGRLTAAPAVVADGPTPAPEVVA